MHITFRRYLRNIQELLPLNTNPDVKRLPQAFPKKERFFRAKKWKKLRLDFAQHYRTKTQDALFNENIIGDSMGVEK
jgi:hypothetical protein